ncbi:MAG TPA: hypothetical protein VFF30_18020 [Nitrososphaerales archaeon]|nr:hypothetical protein [Nitrososphaerales archaeon]
MANRNKYGFIDSRIPEALLILDKKGYLQANYVKLSSRLERSIALIPTYKSQERAVTTLMREFTVSNKLEDDAGSVWPSVDHLVDVGIERSTEYLRWRYAEAWSDYRLVSVLKANETMGYAVLKQRVNRGVALLSVCEMLARDDDVATYDILIKEIVKVARLAHAAYVELSSSCLPGYSDSIKKNGFFVPGLFQGRMRNAGAHLVGSSRNQEIATTLKQAKWHHSIGDKDFA